MEAKTPAISTAKLEACLKGLQLQHTKLGEQIATLEALLLEANTPAQTARTWLVGYSAAWSERYRARFIIANWPKDLAIAKRLLAQLDHAELLERARRYLADRDPFYVEARHPLGLFATNVNRYAGTPPRDEEFLQSPAMGCTHRPLCKTDVQHTRRVAAELRQ